ncbi:hypothetical protein RI129_010186 [Pyrocoelia pectoralis]|uniref:Uncharacterized protein n=1 Tax=Pyrocoelia pectoralis TaxID=417401 RepID=A0AAN7VCZ7_9COLE
MINYISEGFSGRRVKSLRRSEELGDHEYRDFYQIVVEAVTNPFRLIFSQTLDKCRGNRNPHSQTMLFASLVWLMTSRRRSANYEPFQSRCQNSNILAISINYCDALK